MSSFMKSHPTFPKFHAYRRMDGDMSVGAPQVCQRAHNWLYRNCSYAYDVSLTPYQVSRGSLLSSDQRGIEIRAVATLRRYTTL
jgi:hypothetical protein